MSDTNDVIIRRINKAVKDKKKLTHFVDKSQLSTQDRVKWSLCRRFVQYAVENRLKLKEFSTLTKLPMSRLSEIMNYKINKFTVDQLLKNLSVLAEKDQRIYEYIKLFEQVAELPTLKVADTRKILKSVMEFSQAAG